MASAPENAGDAAATSRTLVVAVLVVLMLAHVAPYAWATVFDDTARDFSHARLIVEHHELPLRGPVINQMAHLGPAWFYLFAAFLAATGSISGTLLLVGAGAALKFPLAYACGSLWRSRAYGLAWAVLLAFPGWGLLQQVWVTHWNLVEALGLGAIWCLLRLAQGARPGYWVAYGLLQGAAVHAHPSAVVLAVGLPAVLWQRGRDQTRRDLPAMALGVVASFAGFLPMLVAERSDGWPALERIANFVAERGAIPWHASFGAFVDGALFGGWRFVVRDLVPTSLAPAMWCLGILTVLGLFAGAIAACRQRAGRRRLLTWIATLLLALFAIRMMRPVTPFYMTLVWWVLAAGACALPIESLLRERGGARWLARATLFAALAASLIASSQLILRAELGSMRLPAHTLGDLARRDASRPILLLPAWRHDDIGRRLCESRRPVVVHGELAVALHAGISLGSRLHCGASGDPWIGGGAYVHAAEHWLGLLPESRRAAGFADAAWSEVARASGARVIAADASQRAPDRLDNEFRRSGAGEPRTHRFAFSAWTSDVVVVSQIYALFDGSHLRSASADGRPARALRSLGGVTTLECDGCGEGRVPWVVEIESGFADRIDLVVAPRDPSHSR